MTLMGVEGNGSEIWMSMEERRRPEYDILAGMINKNQDII